MSPPLRLLIIDDEEAIRFALARYFRDGGYEIETAATLAAGRDQLAATRPEVVFLDLRLPDGDGLELLAEAATISPNSRIVVMTAYGTLDTVRQALDARAFEYLVKPIDLGEAADLVRQIQASLETCAAPPPPAPPHGFVGASPAMQELYKRIGQAARADAAVLIEGETGTGKELTARALHACSRRAGGPFAAVNCGALSAGLLESELFGHVRGSFTGAVNDKIGRFEAACGGTLFLDEIGELPLPAQVKLLRALDSAIIERVGSVAPIRVDARIVAATNRDLQAEVAAGRFRADLYFRLAVLRLTLPTLRQRREDIPALAECFLAEFAAGDTPRLSREARDKLLAHAWPGNVRELRNAMAQAAAVCAGGLVLPAHLPDFTPATRPGGDPLDVFLDRLEKDGGNLHARALAELESRLIERALAATGGNRSLAAER
ncbi:MAG: sigma-54 dependent transcriptional regulator, partial [Lentisphaeria bacterium]|nr:sigma-54 dependent transcriptional regulator [Lentisphaeria bacterium]